MISFTKSHGSIQSHAMFFCEEAQTYIHVWGVETDSPIVKMNIPSSKAQKKVYGKKMQKCIDFTKSQIK
ncbi:hypothetical protein TH1_154 [Shewanella phage Thanatos-1]|nr:hypothetical protein TH1_154 [Shewanella phage Thanatos-1]